MPLYNRRSTRRWSKGVVGIDRITILEQIADAAEEIYYDATGIDEDTMENEYYRVPGKLVEKIGALLYTLEEHET